MTDHHPLISRYLHQLETELDASGVSARECKEILRDIASHAAEAERTGQSVAAVLEKLGPARDLADAYAAALFLLPVARADAPVTTRIMRAISRAGAVCASLLLVVVMGAVGLGLVVTGAAAVLGGIILPFVPATWLDPTLRRGLPQVVVIIIGGLLLIVGVLSLRLVRINIRLIVRALHRSSKENPS